MKRFEDRISIHSPAGRVFDYFADFARHGEWSGHGLQVSQPTKGPVAVGTKFSTTAKQFGTQREQSTITELTPGKTVALGFHRRTRPCPSLVHAFRRRRVNDSV
jgi:hypothetical protein